MDARKLARQMRQSMAREEVKLWLQLKHFNARGFHFRRQVPLDGYILDFAEFGQNLIIEVDGSQHNNAEHQMRDRNRDLHFQLSGFRVLRFWNHEINQSMDGVIDKILSVLPDPPPSGFARHLPRKGGG